MTIDDYLKMPEKYIPDGMYCYGSDGLCPFWDCKPGKYPKQEDGYCHFLGKSDWELNEERKDTTILIHAPNNVKNEGKSLSELFDDEVDPVSGKVIHFGVSLIWDQCKECGINLDDPDDVEYITISNDNLGLDDLLTKIKENKK